MTISDTMLRRAHAAVGIALGVLRTIARGLHAMVNGMGLIGLLVLGAHAWIGEDLPLPALSPRHASMLLSFAFVIGFAAMLVQVAPFGTAWPAVARFYETRVLAALAGAVLLPPLVLVPPAALVELVVGAGVKIPTWLGVAVAAAGAAASVALMRWAERIEGRARP